MYTTKSVPADLAELATIEPGIVENSTAMPVLCLITIGDALHTDVCAANAGYMGSDRRVDKGLGRSGAAHASVEQLIAAR